MIICSYPLSKQQWLQHVDGKKRKKGLDTAAWRAVKDVDVMPLEISDENPAGRCNNACGLNQSRVVQFVDATPLVLIKNQDHSTRRVGYINFARCCIDCNGGWRVKRAKSSTWKLPRPNTAVSSICILAEFGWLRFLSYPESSLWSAARACTCAAIPSIAPHCNDSTAVPLTHSHPPECAVHQQHGGCNGIYCNRKLGRDAFIASMMTSF